MKWLLVLVLAGCATAPVEAPADPSKLLWRIVCDMDGATVRINLGATGPGVWVLSGDELACTHKVPTT